MSTDGNRHVGLKAMPSSFTVSRNTKSVLLFEQRYECKRAKFACVVTLRHAVLDVRHVWKNVEALKLPSVVSKLCVYVNSRFKAFVVGEL